MIRIGWLAAAAMLVFASAAEGQVCSGDAVALAAKAVSDAERALPTGDVTDVARSGQSAIATMKDRLDDFVRAAMLCQGDAPRADAVKAALARFGDKVRFEVRVPAAPSDLVAIRARFGIPCGEDAMLMIFWRRDHAWGEVLRTQSKPYKTVAGAWWTFDYAISKPDAQGNWFVAIKSVAPWCSSTWSEIDYAILRPATDPKHPVELLHGRDGMWWGNDEYGTLTAGADFVDLRFRSGSMDLGVHNRTWIRHFSVTGDVVRRTEPLAENPRDFADEWVVRPWREAGDWVPKAAIARLRAVHDRVHAISYFDYASLHGCGTGRFQIEAQPSDVKYGTASFFFQVEKGASYRMLDVTRSPDSACTAPDTVDPPLTDE